MMLVIPRKTLIVGFGVSKFGYCKLTTLPKNVFSLGFCEFFQKRPKEQLLLKLTIYQSRTVRNGGKWSD